VRGVPLGISPWLKAFLITLLVEVPLAAFLLRQQEPRLSRLLLAGVYANLATHPLVWFVFATLPLRPWAGIALAELWAWLGEALFFVVVWRGLSWRRAAGVALLTNGASFGLGLLLYRWLQDWMLT